MKLHLPSALRKALMACLAALSLPVTLPTTLGTASGIAAVGLISAQRVTAEDVTITSKRGDNSYNSALESRNVAGNKWIFDVPTMDFNFGIENPAELKSPTHEADFEFRQTLTVNNGFNNSTNTFNGAFTGGEGADLLFESWNNNVTNTWVFNGDLSQFQGSIRCTTDPAKPSVTQGILEVRFAEGAKTNTGAIKQEGTGTLNLTLTGQSVSNSEISVNNFTLNGEVSFSDHTRATVAGKMVFGDGAVLTIEEGGLLRLPDVVEGDNWTINLVTDDEDFENPDWLFTGGIQGLDAASRARVTINGHTVDELTGGDKQLEFSGDGLHLVDKLADDTDTFVPGVKWSENWVDLPDDYDDYEELVTGGVDSYRIRDSVKIIGGGAEMSVRLQKMTTGGDSYGGCHLAGDPGDAADVLTLANLYLTADPDEITGDGGKQLYFDIKGANYLSAVQDVWVRNVGLIIQVDMEGQTTNFHLGKNDHAKSGGWFDDEKYRKFTLCLQANLSTEGVLEVVEDARIVFDGSRTLTVGLITGEGDLSLSSVGTSATSTLAITGDSSTFRGHIIFAQSDNYDTVVRLGEGITLSTAGIRTGTTDTDGSFGGRFAVEAGGEATVMVTGENTDAAHAARGVVFDEGVTLKLEEGSSQFFGDFKKTVGEGETAQEVVVSTEISRLTGGGTLGVVGSVIVNALDAGYTGEVHYDAEGKGVLQLGCTVDTEGGTLKRVVIQQGGGEMRLGRGKWVLDEVQFSAGGPGTMRLGCTVETGGATLGRVVGEGELTLGRGRWYLNALGQDDAGLDISRLDVRAAEGERGARLTFGESEGMKLRENTELKLHGGIDYSGTIVVDATGGATGARLFEVDDAALLEGMHMQVIIDAGDVSRDWEGLQLFTSGLDLEMKDALLGRGKEEDERFLQFEFVLPEGGEIEMPEGMEWGITDDGRLCIVQEEQDLVWEATEGGVWKEGGTTQWSGDQGGEYTFRSGDTVYFRADGGEKTVQVEGTVRPREVRVEGADYTFVGSGEDSVIEIFGVDGGLVIEGTGAKATISGTLGLRTKQSQVRGELHLETTGALVLGAAEVDASGAIYLGSGAVTAGNWDDGTIVSGEGRVVLDTDAEVNETNDLFTKLFAGGDTEAERDAEHAGIGTFEVGEGVTLKLGNVGKSVSLVRSLQVREGGSLVVTDKVFDNDFAGYTRVGTVVLAGSGKMEGAEPGAGSLVFNVEGGTVFRWNVVLEGDAVIANNNSVGEVNFAGQSEFDAAGHTVTLEGGAFRFGEGAGDGFHAAEGSTGTLTLTDNARLAVDLGQTASFAGYNIELDEGTTFTAQSEATFNDVGGTGSLVVEAGKTFTLVGSVRNEGTEEVPEPEGSVEVTLDGGATLVIGGNDGAETSWLSRLRLINGDSTVMLTMGAETDYSESGVLRVDSVINNAKKLTLALDGIQNYIDTHRDEEGGWDWTIQLFTGGAAAGLYEMWKTGDFLLEGVIGYNWQLDGTGKLILAEITDVYTWTDSEHGGVHRLTWSNGVVGNALGQWDGDGTYKNGVTANLVGDTGEAVTVSISGDVEAKAVNISGSSEFTFNAADEGGNLHTVDMSVGADSIFNPEITLERRMTVQAGKTATFTGGLATANGSEVVLEEGATVKLVGDNILKGGVRRKMRVTGNGNWDVDLSGASEQTYDGTGVTLTDGVKMRLTGFAGEENVWSNILNLNVQGEFELAAGEQVVFTGTNAVGVLRVVYSNSADVFSVDHLVLEGSGSTLNITGEGDTDLRHVVLDIRGGTFTQTKGTLTVGGLRSNAQDGGTLRAQNLAITADDKWDIYDAANTGGQRGYTGNLEIAGNLTMNGKLWEEESGGDPGNGGGELDPGGDPGSGGGEVDPGGDPGNGGGELDPGGDLGSGGGEVDPGGDPGSGGGEVDPGGDLGNGGGEVDPGGDLGNGGGDLGDVGGELGEEGGMEIDEDFVQHLDGEVSVGGAVMVQSGVLDVGGKRFDVVGQLSVSGGQFKWHGEDGEEMTMGSLNITGDGTVELAMDAVEEGESASGNVTVNGGISGDGGKLSISGAPRNEVTDKEAEVALTVTLKGEERASYAGEVRLGEGGTLAVESTGQVFTQMSAANGKLTVGDGKNLVVAALNDAVATDESQTVRGGLQGVTLGARSNWTVQSGSFSLTGTLKWGSGASITLDCVGEGGVTNVLLGRGFGLDETQTPGEPLTFNLTADFLNSLTQIESDKTGRLKAHFLDNEREGSFGWKKEYQVYFSVDAVDDPWNYANLALEEDGTLTWDVKSGATWTEGEEGVAGEWKDEKPSRQWRDVQDPSRGWASLKDINIYLAQAGAGADGRATLNVDGTVKPGSVYVEGGEYTLTQKEGTEGGMNVGGMLVVQGGAVLNLNLENTRLPLVVVEGTLGLGRAGALPSGTELRLNKEGTLRYTEPGAAQDVSGMVSAKGSSTALHIEVGEGVGADGVTWGTNAMDPAANTGLKFALDSGTVKSGKGNFTLRWADASTDAVTHAGKQEVRAGRLILEAGRKSVLSGEVVVAEGASLVLKAADTLTYSGTATGGGALEVAQGAVTLSGNSTTGRVTLTGGTAILGSDGALGNENTVLTLSGGDIQAGSRNKVNAGSVEVVQGQETAITAGDVEIAGTVTGRGTLKVEGTAKGTLSGDVSEFMGTLDTGTSTWTLSKAGGETGARVAGQGKLVVDSKDAITLTGDLGIGATDRVTLQNNGGGDLVLATGRIGSGTQLQTSKGNIVLGNADTHIELGNGAADWAFGAITGEGSLVLSNVTLPHGGVFGKVAGTMKLVVSTATAPTAGDTPQATAAETRGGIVDVAGMDAGRLDGVTVNEHGLFTGATGEYTVSKEKGLGLHFTAENWMAGADMSGLQYLISGQGATTEGTPEAGTESAFSIHQGNGEGLQLAFDASILTSLREGETTFCVRVLDGETAAWDVTADGSALYNALQNSDDQVANALAMAWDGVGTSGFTKDGFVLSVQLRNLYLVAASGGDKHESTSPFDLMSKKATVVLDGQTLSLNWTEDGIVRNLMGTKGVGLDIHRTATETPSAARLNVSFDNTYYVDVDDDRGEGHLSSADWVAVKGQDTMFDGTITGAEGVDITKTGLGTLTVGGNYTLVDGATRIERGRIVLSGEVNSMKSLEFAYTDPSDPGKEENNNDAEERGLVLDGGHTTLESIVDAGSVGDGPGVVLQNGAELSLSGASTAEHTAFTGGEGGGTITLESSENSDGSLALSGGASIRDVAVKLNGKNTVLDVGHGENSLSALSGSGVLRGAPGGNLSVGGGEFSGTLDVTPGGSGTKGGRLTVVEGASFSLKNASSTAQGTADGWDVDVKQGGRLTLDLTGKTANAPLVFGDVSVAGDLAMNLDASIGGAPVKGSLSLTDTATFTVYGTGKHGDTFSLGFSTSMSLELLRERLKLEGAAFVLDEVEDVSIAADGTIVIRTRLAKETLEKNLSGVHRNSHAGFNMLLDAIQNQSGALANPNSYFSEMVLTMFDNIKKGEVTGVDRSLAAIAGSSISTLGSAVSQDMHRQLSAIRNRTTTMAAEVTQQSYDMLPLWHAWINGESGYHKLDADSFAPGFTLNNWGGTIGVDVDLAPHATVGLAVTAMYGDLKTEDAPDAADGSVDSVYVSAFLRATSGAWVHTLVFSAGAADISLDRTVNYGTYSYRTSGSTNGFSLGALYEVGYSRVVNKNGTVAVQPVFNVELRHIGIDGYTETGSDGALTVDDVDQTVVTFGAGVRMQAAVGTNAFNRTTVFESRLLAKVDAGDRSGSATTGIKGGNTSAEVESAEVGAFGVEAGAGISVPLGRNYGSLFLDGSLEFRDGWTSANATLGYRINF